MTSKKNYSGTDKILNDNIAIVGEKSHYEDSKRWVGLKDVKLRPGA